jgi:hypothetical protein
MSMRRRLAAMASVGFVIAAVTAFTIAPAAPAARPTGTATISPNPVPITGAITSLGGGTFTGTISQIQFVNQAGQLALQGLVNGTLTSATGVVTPVVDQLITLPVSSGTASGACTILDLTIQPIDLNLLGLMVHTDTIHLLISAQPGPGNLLGNLLCGVANALNGGGGGLANLLNNLLGL